MGFSPCPNDTFIFDALVNGPVNCEGIDFDFVIADVEELNRMTAAGKLDISKISMAAYPAISAQYCLLNSGSAIGHNNGPLLIAKTRVDLKNIESLKIAIPGRHTTANLLLGIAFPLAQNKVEMLFSEIENAVLTEKADAGLVIHESRFTFEQKGLMKIVDFGEFWNNSYNQLLPLGGIVARRSLGNNIISQIDKLIHHSLAYAFANPLKSQSFIKQHAREMDNAVIQQHIALYVNEYSLNLGQNGRAAIAFLFNKAANMELLPRVAKPVFIN